jgi:hypothetical protein
MEVQVDPEVPFVYIVWKSRSNPCIARSTILFVYIFMENPVLTQTEGLTPVDPEVLFVYIFWRRIPRLFHKYSS